MVRITSLSTLSSPADTFQALEDATAKNQDARRRCPKSSLPTSQTSTIMQPNISNKKSQKDNSIFTPYYMSGKKKQNLLY